MKKNTLTLLLILTLCSTFLYSQESEIAVPYKPDEFPQWAVDLRRTEIITIGSFPLSFMFTAIIYDVAKFASDSSIPFGSSRSQDDIKNMLLISGGVSLAVGLTDFIIQQVKRSKIEKEQQKLDEQRNNNSESPGLIENES